MDRSRIVRAADDGGNWRQLAEQLGVNHKTAYTWFVKVATKHSRKGEDAESVLMNKSMFLLPWLDSNFGQGSIWQLPQRQRRIA
jgi:transposase-like protein